MKTPLTAALGTATRDALVPTRQIPGFRIDERVIDETRNVSKPCAAAAFVSARDPH
jgi:hypothetical protein